MAWPTTKNPRKNFVTVRLTDAEAADLDWLIGATNAKDRSAALRTSFERVVKVERARAAKKARSRSGTHAPIMDGDDDE